MNRLAIKGCAVFMADRLRKETTEELSSRQLEKLNSDCLNLAIQAAQIGAFPIYVKPVIRPKAIFLHGEETDYSSGIDWARCEVNRKDFEAWFVLSRKPHGNTIRNAEKRLLTKNKAMWLINEREDECRGPRGKITQESLWQALGNYSAFLFNSEHPPVGRRIFNSIYAELKEFLCN